MGTERTRVRSPRTMLEQRIQERCETFEEFAEFATTFARQHGEPGTLSARHVKRLAAGHGESGKPLGQPRPVTARLLERIFGLTVDVLLSPPCGDQASAGEEDELRAMLRVAARVDGTVLRLLREQLTATRRLDRQLGAIVAHDEVLTKITQVTRLMGHSLTPTRRQQLAALLSELHTLAGWQALDMGKLTESWRHYSRGSTIAKEATTSAYDAHTTAGQAFVLIDLGDTSAAAELLAATRAEVDRKTDRLLRSWLAAAHGETLAADGQRSASLCAFDQAAEILPDDATEADDGPYLALDSVHLARWRGHALARVGAPDAINVLQSALDRLDPTFTRAEAALHADLATAFITTDEQERAQVHVQRAHALAADIGSARQHRRITQLRAPIA
ncbi:MAG: hypothetical protein ACRDRN_17465 [Sciscionella sp.]